MEFSLTPWLQPGEWRRRKALTVSTVCALMKKPLKRFCSPPLKLTRLKPGVNEKSFNRGHSRSKAAWTNPLGRKHCRKSLWLNHEVKAVVCGLVAGCVFVFSMNFFSLVVVANFIRWFFKPAGLPRRHADFRLAYLGSADLPLGQVTGRRGRIRALGLGSGSHERRSAQLRDAGF